MRLNCSNSKNTEARSQNSEYRGRATKGVNSKKCTLVLLTFPSIFTPFVALSLVIVYLLLIVACNIHRLLSNYQMEMNLMNRRDFLKTTCMATISAGMGTFTSFAIADTLNLNSRDAASDRGATSSQRTNNNGSDGV